MNENLFFDTISANAHFTEKALEQKLELIKADSEFEKFSTLEKAMRYSLLAGGKRLRPCLVIEFAKLFGASEKEEA